MGKNELIWAPIVGVFVNPLSAGTIIGFVLR